MKTISIRFDHNMNPSIIDLKYGVRASPRHPDREERIK